MAQLQLEKNSLVDKRYEIIERKGQGSFAEIFIAYDRSQQNQLIILKALNTTLQGTPDPELVETLEENFHNEVIALEAVRHPNIIRYLGQGKAQDSNGQAFPYLVLEYMAGGDLLQRCRQQLLSFDEMLYYVKQVCEALHCAHGCQVIHRDIKPNNLLLSEDSSIVKIADFGVAKIAPRANEEVTRVGTDTYAAPEHHPLILTGDLNEPAQLTSSADIYSLAKTVYTLLSGQPPRRFTHRSIIELPTQLQHEPWAEPLLKVLRRATDAQIENRYADAISFYQDLAEVKVAAEEVTQVRTRSNQTATTRPLAVTIKPSAEKGGYVQQQAKIVVQLPCKEPNLSTSDENRQLDKAVEPEEKSEKPSEKPTQKTATGAKHSILERADSFIFIHRKKILTLWATILFIGLSFFFYMTFQSADAQGDLPAAVVTRDVFIRSGPSISSNVVGWLRSGAKLRVLEHEPNNWYLVEVVEEEDRKTSKAKQGWVYGSYINISLDLGKD
ncbi:MAG: serine/threonine protein kinase [Acidobacteriota bacterium]